VELNIEQNRRLRCELRALHLKTSENAINSVYCGAKDTKV